MTARTPPLNALRAFEAAARHLSFKRAAEELNVTPAAVGHQIRSLEAHLGVRLFRRLNRSLMLTDAGQAGLPLLREGFARLAQGVARMRAEDARGRLTVAVEPAFAAGWLVRRLAGFQAAHPDIDILLDASARVVDLAREDVDVAIRYGRGAYPGTRADLLMTESVFPVLSPDLLAAGPAIEKPADLAHYTLLHDDAESEDDSWPDWPAWFRAAGAAGVDAERGPRFSQTNMMLDAVHEGQGVALAGASMVADSLREGWLVRPLGPEFETPLELAYYVVSLRSRADWPKVAAFRNWLLAQARAAGQR